MLDFSELEDIGYKADEPDQNVIERFRFDDALDVPPELTDLDLWTNYVNDDLYEMDKKVREFLKKTRYRREKDGYYRTTVPMVFAWIYGRRATSSDSMLCRTLHELMRYYCTCFTGKTTYNGKRVDRVYEFSKYATVRRKPYSLRLRLEECDGGKMWIKSGDNKKKRRHGRRSDPRHVSKADLRSGGDERGNEVGDRDQGSKKRS